MAYVYRHIRLDKNEPFYIGIGSDNSYNRAYQKSKTKRSKFWHNIASKGYDVEILMDNLTWEQACEKEKEFISIYGRKDLGQGSLVNLTNGGENPPIHIGNTNPMKRIENKEKVANKRKGMSFTNEHKTKLSIAAKLRNQIPPSRKGQSMSKEGIEKMLETRLKNGKLRKKIFQYDTEFNLIKTWNYALEIKKTYKNYSVGNIHSVCRKERKIAYGYIWTYELITP
jgi:hypothetical protein